MTQDPTPATYDEVAGDYSELRKDRTALVPVIDAFVGLVPANGVVLDVGCGPGYESQTLSTRGLRVVGFDLSLPMLKVAGKSYDGALTLGDMRHLPLRSGFDAIWCCASLLHIPRSDAPVALCFINNALKPGGVFYVAVKRGEGEEVSDKPFGHPRLFTYWQDKAFDA